MHGKNSFPKKIGRLERRTAKKSKPLLSDGSKPVVKQTDSVDVGNWRITEDEDGSLILYQFETGSKVIIARP